MSVITKLSYDNDKVFDVELSRDLKTLKLFEHRELNFSRLVKTEVRDLIAELQVIHDRMTTL